MVISFIGSGFYYDQSFSSTNQINKIEDQLKSNQIEQDDAIKELNLIFEESDNLKKLKAGSLLLTLYNNLGNLNKVLELSKEIQDDAKLQNDLDVLINIHYCKASAFTKLGLKNHAEEELLIALDYADKYSDKNKQLYNKSFLSIKQILLFEQKKKSSITKALKKQIKNIESLQVNSSITKQQKINLLASTYLQIGNQYLEKKPNDLDSARLYIFKGFDLTKKHINSYDFQLNNYSILAKFYYKNNQYKEAISTIKQALTLEKKYNSIYDRKNLYELLSKSYIANKKIDESNQNFFLFTNLNDSINKIERNSIDFSLNNLMLNLEKKEKNTYQFYIKTIIFLLSIVIIFLTIISYLFWKQKNKTLTEKYENLRQNQTIEKVKKEEHKVKKRKKKTLISKDTNSELLRKLDVFEESEKFLSKDVNLTWLANYLGTNPKYLSEILKNEKSKNFNKYINSLRIKHITNLLENNLKFREYKIKYLAEFCGFASSQVFVIAFKNETNLTPSEYIENLKLNNLS